jgi:hypothetical protein
MGMFRSLLSMTVDEVEFEGVAILESEDEPHVAAFLSPRERMSRSDR